jgi:hypothetical protein
MNAFVSASLTCRWRAVGRPAAVAGLLAFSFLPGVAAAQAPAAAPPADVRGTVVAGETRQPVAGATVTVEERRGATVKTDESGNFTVQAPAGAEIHLRVSAGGFLPARVEVPVTRDLAPIEIVLQDDLHYAEAVTVGPAPRDPFESYQPTSVLSGQDRGNARRAAADGAWCLRAVTWTGPIASDHPRPGRGSRARAPEQPAHR